MKKLITIITAVALALIISADAANITVSAPSRKTLTPEVPATSGLNKLFVVDAMTGVSVRYTPNSQSAQVNWLKYSSLGGGYAEPAACHQDSDGSWLLDTPEGDMGYIVEEGTDRFYFWLTDYSKHYLTLDALTPTSGSDCSMEELMLTGSASPITYYAINGRALELSRELKVEYTTLEFDSETETYRQKEVEQILASAGTAIHVPAALCQTIFTLSGDRFLREWGLEESVSSPTVEAHSVEAHTTATRQGETAENEVSDGDDSELGGSAPATVEFKAVVTDAAIFTEWQMSDRSDFEEITFRETQPEFAHTFTELGTTYIRFVCDNAEGTCQWTGDTYEVHIGESSLLCPNAFSPGASEGVNDEWKVSYKSLISFECHIFDRNGRKMISFTDPAQGWDGRHGGKLVPAGVYYYVIKARGADGKEYNLGGDINIINYK